MGIFLREFEFERARMLRLNPNDVIKEPGKHFLKIHQLMDLLRLFGQKFWYEPILALFQQWENRLIFGLLQILTERHKNLIDSFHQIVRLTALTMLVCTIICHRVIFLRQTIQILSQFVLRLLSTFLLPLIFRALISLVFLRFLQFLLLLLFGLAF